MKSGEASTILDPRVVFLSGHACPGCDVALEWPGDRVDSWVRCPNCNRPIEPPSVWSGPSLLTDRRSPLSFAATEGASTIAGASAAGWERSVAGIGFVVLLLVDLVLRFVWVVDPMTQMAADVGAFLSLSIWGFLALRSRVRR